MAGVHADVPIVYCGDGDRSSSPAFRYIALAEFTATMYRFAMTRGNVLHLNVLLHVVRRGRKRADSPRNRHITPRWKSSISPSPDYQHGCHIHELIRLQFEDIKSSVFREVLMLAAVIGRRASVFVGGQSSHLNGQCHSHHAHPPDITHVPHRATIPWA
jgi:hypothetical protein